MTGIEDLGEEHPQGNGGVKEPVAEASVFGLDSVLDLLGREDVGEGQRGGVGELSAKPCGLAGGRRGGTRSHEMASLRCEDQSHSHSSKVGHLFLTPSPLNAWSLCPCHSGRDS
jgi:hypothetical protein